MIDLEELLQKIEDGTSDLCCPENHDITLESAVFEHSGDPTAAARELFVWSIYSHNNTNKGGNLFTYTSLLHYVGTTDIYNTCIWLHGIMCVCGYIRGFVGNHCDAVSGVSFPPIPAHDRTRVKTLLYILVATIYYNICITA